MIGTILTTSTSTVSLKHKTSLCRAVQIALSGSYVSFNNPGHYDCGMNFLGVLGEYANTQPTHRGATLLCTWKGCVSAPLPYDYWPHEMPDVLYDFNGSGNHYINNDPRYLLPYGSSGVVLNEIIYDSEGDLIDVWRSRQKWHVKALCQIGYGGQWQLYRARNFLGEINEKARKGNILINVFRGFE